MIKIIFNGQSIDVNEGITLQEFIGQHGTFGSGYFVNGVAVAPETILSTYNVVEGNAQGTIVNQELSVTMVDINLTDFTGASGIVRCANSIDAVRERYNQNVRITVIRDGQTVENTALLTGDRVMVTPAGGVKGA